MNGMVLAFILVGLALLLSGCRSVAGDGGIGGRRDESSQGWYFPPPGNGLSCQDWRTPEEVGLSADLPAKIADFIACHADTRKAKTPRWALWRHGRLVHLQGDFTETTDVASLRKTWHAMIVGAAIQQGRIPSLRQEVVHWSGELKERFASVTWRDILTQSAGFDYPYGDYPAYRPGQMWTYSDYNLFHLCNALARVYGRKDFHDHYELVARQAYFDAIGMTDWSTAIRFDRSSNMEDGVRFQLSLEHMGRLGLLALARGRWGDRQLVPGEFVGELETKQTRGMKVNYQGPNDGKVRLDPKQFPESPYGYLTWVNTEGDYFPGADRAWAWGAGIGGMIVLWNHANGIVFAGAGVNMSPSSVGLPHVIEQGIIGQDPQLAVPSPARTAQKTIVGRWDRFEVSLSNPRTYADPYKDVELNVVFTKPDGARVGFWGFYDGGTTWKVRFMPDQLGAWRYQARFSDGSLTADGVFYCVASDIPGMLSVHESNPIWFGFKDGPAMLVRSFHVGDRFFATNWDDPNNPDDGNKRTVFLDWARQQGYNMLSIASHYLNRHSPSRGEGWDTPAFWPLNASEYRWLETILDDLSRRKIMVFPFGGFFGRDTDFPREPAERSLFIRYTLARLGAYWNILLNVAGPEPLLKNKTYLTFDEINSLGAEIRRLDVFGHPLTVHNPTGEDAFRDSQWSAFGTLQGPKTTDRAKLGVLLLRYHHPAKPLYAQETLWSGNKNHPVYTDTDLRKNAFVLMMSAAVLNFADNAGNSSTGFSGTLEPADRNQSVHDIIKHVWDFFETVPFQRMKPMPEIIEVVAGGNAWCLAEPGREYLIYLESRGIVNVSVEGGPYCVEWINAQDTSQRRPAEMTVDGKNLRSPDEGDDWLVRLYTKTQSP
jgi:hypothetical protein